MKKRTVAVQKKNLLIIFVILLAIGGISTVILLQKGKDEVATGIRAPLQDNDREQDVSELDESQKDDKAQTATTLIPPTNSSDTEEETEEETTLSASKNLEMILSSSMRNTSFDANEYADVPIKDIPVSGLTENADLYDEGLLDTSQSGFFRVKCEVSHFAYDDPIVFPNEPGNGHLHMFFGNTKTNAYSTFDSLLNTGTGSCNGEDLNRTAYWLPALLDEKGYALLPDHIMVYYKNDDYMLLGEDGFVEPFPDDLRMIAGDGRATTPQNGFTGDYEVMPHVSFSCGPAYGDNNKQPLIPDCSAPNFLEVQVAFPSCWDGENSFSEKQTHTSHPVGGFYGVECPDTHPHHLSSIMYRVFFKPEDYGGTLRNLYLSSDVRDGKLLPGGTTLHADWFGAWHPEAMDEWVTNCNNTQADCEIGLLNRDPMVSMIPRKTGFYPRGHKIAPEQLAALCPGEKFDASNPVVSLSHCGRGSDNDLH